MILRVDLQEWVDITRHKAHERPQCRLRLFCHGRSNLQWGYSLNKLDIMDNISDSGEANGKSYSLINSVINLYIMVSVTPISALLSGPIIDPHCSFSETSVKRDKRRSCC